MDCTSELLLAQRVGLKIKILIFNLPVLFKLEIKRLYTIDATQAHCGCCMAVRAL